MTTTSKHNDKNISFINHSRSPNKIFPIIVKFTILRKRFECNHTDLLANEIQVIKYI